MTWTFTLPIDLRSKNRIANARDARLSGAIKKRYRDQWAAWARHAAMAVGLLPFTGSDTYRRRRVTITRLMGKTPKGGWQRAYDRDDGLEGGDAATLRDALQMTRTVGRRLVNGAGLVVRDDERWSDWAYGQERSPDGRPGVRVTIENITEEKS